MDAVAAFSLQGQTALVTGAGRNLGRSIAIALAEAGADVAVHVRSNISEGEVVADLVRGVGRRAAVVEGDLGRRDDVTRMVTDCAQQLAAPSILILCAAIREHAPVENVTDEMWQRIIDTDLTGPFQLIREVLPTMRAGGWGRIIAIGGNGAHRVRNIKGLAPVAAAKAGLEGLILAVSREIGAYGITANVVAPGAIADDEVKAAKYTTYLGHLGTAAEVADMCVAVCTPSMGYLTGEVLHADGGGILFSASP